MPYRRSRPTTSLTHSLAGQRRLIRYLLPLALACLGFLSLLPLLWMVMSSLKPTSEIFSPQFSLVPRHPSLANYREVAGLLPLLRNIWNSFAIASLYTVLSLFFCSLGGFAFAKFNFPGRKGLFYLLLMTMMIPGEVGLVPLFIIMTRLHLVNTYLSLALPGAANAFGIFFMRQYMFGLPDEIIEAAKIDGCNDFKLYRRIAVPMSLPALGALGIMDFMGSWNSFLLPLIMLRTPKMNTIMLAIPSLLAAGFSIPWGAIMAGSVLAVLPLLVVFLCFQRSFVSGISLGGVKG